jgi:hypothetical protein
MMIWILLIIYVLGFVATFFSFAGITGMLCLLSPEPFYKIMWRAALLSFIWPIFWIYLIWADWRHQ